MTPRVRRDPLGAAERTALLEEGLSIARHDLRNNLATIRNAAFYLRRKMSQTSAWGVDPRVERFFAIIEEEIVGAQASVDERVLSDRLIQRDTAPVDGLVCLRDAVTWARAEGDVRVVYAVDDGGPPLIAADPRDLSVALRCLIENALEATAPEGAATVRVAVARDDRRVVFTVVDAGPGIALEEIDRVAERFFSTKQGHDGLGLNVVMRIARRYGGVATIQPREPGSAGTSVELALPLFEGDHRDG